MHELGLAEGILAVAMDLAGERTVSRVTVRIGDEQCIVADSLEFGFRLLAEDTVCAQAALECVPVEGATVLVDEVELVGDPPTVLRRPGAEVTEPPHEHHHERGPDALRAPVGSATHGGA